MAQARRQPKSKYTLDRGIPGAFEGETVTRRRFMTGTVHGAGMLMTAGFTLPAIGFALGPIFHNYTLGWQSVGYPRDFPDNNYIPIVITTSPGIGEAGKSTVYIRQRDPSVDKLPQTKYNRWVAITSRCSHLGCSVLWVEASERFVCPCHGSVFDAEGVRVSGPAPRPLDRFYTRLFEGQVQVGPRYSVNNELRPFSPRDPGEPLDGIGQYAYPSRPSVRKLPGNV
ncbi:MAG: ubiquinol-cytochrome c reductase iron-sulfur subunit [Solirubrobacteraceae bacterium]